MLTKEKKLEIVDRVTKHLLTQMERAEAPGESRCVYVAPDGKRCAIGAIMSDEALDYLTKHGCLRAGLWSSAKVRKALVTSGILDSASDLEDLDLLVRLQRIHDNRQPSEWSRELELLRARVENGQL